MSGLRCRPNDLAVIVRAPNFPQFIGRIVRVTQLDRFPPAAWHTDPPLWEDGGLVIAEDRCLRPIRPDADEPATETEREKEAA